MLYVFLMGAQSSALGALLTFAGTPWYPAYAPTTAAWGLSPLEDQQLAGLIMWMPAGTLYLAVVLTLLAVWLHRAEQRASRGSPATAVMVSRAPSSRWPPSTERSL